MDLANVRFSLCRSLVASWDLHFAEDLQRELRRLPRDLSPELPISSERHQRVSS